MNYILLDGNYIFQNNNDLKASDHQSLLSYLTSSRVLSRDVIGYLERRDLTSDETIAHVLSFIGEIFSTMTASLQFMIYELAMNPDCQQTLYEEVMSSCPNDNDVTVNKLQEMEYFDMFYNETYRMHPIAPGYVYNLLYILKYNTFKNPQETSDNTKAIIMIIQMT